MNICLKCSHFSLGRVFFPFFFPPLPSSSEHILCFRVWKPVKITPIVKTNLTYLYKIFITCKYLEALLLSHMKISYAGEGGLFHGSENVCMVD